MGCLGDWQLANMGMPIPSKWVKCALVIAGVLCDVLHPLFAEWPSDSTFWSGQRSGLSRVKTIYHYVPWWSTLMMLLTIIGIALW